LLRGMTAREGLGRCTVRNTSTGNGKVVVIRAMSLDGFIAGPGDAQDWIFDFMGNDTPWQKEAAAATGAMLVGRRTVEVGERMEASNDRGTESRGEGYPFSGPGCHVPRR
jgi:hypothetical protein